MPPIEIGTIMVVVTWDQAIRKGEEGPPDRRLGWSLSEVCHIPGSSFMPDWVKLRKSAVRRDLSLLI